MRVPEPVGDLGAWIAASVASLGLRRYRALHARHMARVLGRELSAAEARAWARRAFVEYGRYWVEGARLSTLDASTIRARMLVERGYDDLRAAMAAGRGVVLALGHVGAWEWGGAWLALEGYPMTTVAEPIEPRRLYDWFVEQRRRLGIEVLPLDAAAGSSLAGVLRRGGLVGLICDRDVGSSGVEVEFFGERTRLPAGPATLALRTGAALMTAAVYRARRGDHVGVVNPPIDTSRSVSLRRDVERVTQQVARELEGLIKRAPAQWHLFQPNWPSDRRCAAGTPGPPSG